MSVEYLLRGFSAFLRLTESGLWLKRNEILLECLNILFKIKTKNNFVTWILKWSTYYWKAQEHPPPSKKITGWVCNLRNFIEKCIFIFKNCWISTGKWESVLFLLPWETRLCSLVPWSQGCVSPWAQTIDQVTFRSCLAL